MKHILLSIFLTFSISANAQIGNDYSTPFDINNPFKISLTTDFDEFVAKMDDDKFLPARISYKIESGELITKKVKVKARGVFRRKNCEIPPIRIKFYDEDYKVDVFDKLDKVKLVNECDFGNKYQQYLVKEFLTYKAYEQLTDYSLQTWFMQIEFIDSQDSTNRFTSYSFLIEDIDELAKRHNAIEMDTEGLVHKDLDAKMESIAMLFQFMIGNVDVYLENLHNLKLLRDADQDSASPIPIPYDFDFSGLVNTDYATVGDLPIENVRERYYIGTCRTKEEYQRLFDLFMAKKDDVYKIFQTCELLEQVNKEDIIDYLDEFYETIQDEKLAKRNIIKKCW